MYMTPVNGTLCSYCEKILSAPTLSLNNCYHNIRKRCFEKTLQPDSTCRLCNFKITGAKKPTHEHLSATLDHWAKPILERHPGNSSINRQLHAAIKKGLLDDVASLIAQGISVTNLFEGISPLYTACENGKIEIAQLLLENGAISTQKNDLSQVKGNQYWRVNDHQQRHGATPMKAATSIGDRNLVNLLVKYKAPFDEFCLAGRSPVFIATHAGHEDLALFFIENGANIQAKDHFGISLLSLAVRCGRLRIVQELVKRGVDVNELEKSGATALHSAAERENHELLNFLLQNGAKATINVLWLENTPLSSAARSGKVENVKLLVEAGADLSITYLGMDILELTQKSLHRSESLYGSHPQYKEDGEKVIGNERAVVEFLQKVIGDDNMKGKKSMKTVILSDRTSLFRFLIEQTIHQIQQAVEDASADGKSFFLADLKDKASKKDSWLPAQNPFCNSIEIMKTHLLIDDLGHMSLTVRSIIQDCIVENGLNFRLQTPKCLLDL